MLGNKSKKIKINGKVHFHGALSNLAVYAVLSNVCLTPAHKGWGYSHPLRRPGGGGGHSLNPFMDFH